MGTNILAIIGLLTIIFGVSLGIYEIVLYIRQRKNPVKEYIRRIVYQYLEELSKDDNDN